MTIIKRQETKSIGKDVEKINVLLSQAPKILLLEQSWLKQKLAPRSRVLLCGSTFCTRYQVAWKLYNLELEKWWIMLYKYQKFGVIFTCNNVNNR